MALLAGLGLIGLLVWAFSGGGGKPATPPAGSSQTYGLLPAAASRSAAATASAQAGVGATTRGAASPRASGLPSPSATQVGPAAGRLTVGDPAGAGAGQDPGGACAPGTVVLSVFSSRASYSGGQDPRFAVYAVSTAPGTCTFVLGPGTLHLEVMSSGRVIWDSGDCARAADAWTARLSRGIPAVESVTWNRTITLPGCVTLASSARAGTYEAQAWTASVSSAVLSFRLAR